MFVLVRRHARWLPSVVGWLGGSADIDVSPCVRWPSLSAKSRDSGFHDTHTHTVLECTNTEEDKTGKEQEGKSYWTREYLNEK